VPRVDILKRRDEGSNNCNRQDDGKDCHDGSASVTVGRLFRIIPIHAKPSLE
jgi:hypothetical protein